MELSQRESDAGELLDKSRFIIKHYPEWLRVKLDPDQQSMIGVEASYGKIQALPSTEDAGRSTDATLVIADEWEKHPYAEQNFAAIKPTMDKGGIFIACTTINKLNMDSFPKQIWRGAKQKENRFIPLFFNYFSIPSRTEVTYANDTAGLPDWQKEQEYPRSEEEAFSAPKATCFFDRDAISDMFKDCHEPIREKYGGKVRIYKEPVSDRKYVFAIDPSEGRDDPCAGVIADWQTEEDVVCFNGKMSLDEQAKIAFELYEEYNEPYIAVERNAGGLTLVEKLSNMGVKNWYYCSKDKPGWWTQSSNRPVMLNELSEGISLRLLRIPMRDALQEFLEFQWIEGKAQAVRGAHDDWVIAHAIARQIRKDVKIKIPGRIISFKYNQSF